jgi:hypothetical protein
MKLALINMVFVLLFFEYVHKKSADTPLSNLLLEVLDYHCEQTISKSPHRSASIAFTILVRLIKIVEISKSKNRKQMLFPICLRCAYSYAFCFII